MAKTSRLPGFYRLPMEERRRALRDAMQGQDLDSTFDDTLDSGGLTPATADKIVENVLGVYALPFGVGLNFLINGKEVLVPMVVEEPSVIAAASNAAKMIRESGGFHATTIDALMTTQVQLFDVRNADEAKRVLLQRKTELIELGNGAVPNLLRRGGGVRELEVRIVASDIVVIHLHVDCQDAMGANLVNLVAEGIGPTAAGMVSGTLGLRILTNLTDRRRTRVLARVKSRDLAVHGWSQEQNRGIVDAVVQASRFAEVDPYRAATHNKGIMNGIDSVVIATGNDTRAVEAGVHAYAARSGQYRPVAVWRREGEELVGELEVPLALGIVGGTLRVHPLARLALRIVGVDSAAELAHVAASAGLASNLAALRALATEGISRGHLSLHARSVATAAGAQGAEVEQVAAVLAERGSVTVDTAIAVLGELRKASSRG
jgi:hydroxymethylglutaryl-CoA reductase